MRDRLALGNTAQQTTHDFAAAGFWQVVAKADVFGFGNRSNLLANPVAQLFGNGFGLITRWALALEHHKGHNRLAGQVIRTTHDGGFCDQR